MLSRLLVKRPAQTSSAIDSAICAVASVVRKRAAARAPDGCPAWPFSVETRSGRVLCSAGKRPNSRPVPSVSTAGEEQHRRVERRAASSRPRRRAAATR